MSSPSPSDGGRVPATRGSEGAPAVGEGARPLSDGEAPEVPLFRTWRGVYWFVLGSFLAMVLALTVFTHFYA